MGISKEVKIKRCYLERQRELATKLATMIMRKEGAFGLVGMTFGPIEWQAGSFNKDSFSKNPINPTYEDFSLSIDGCMEFLNKDTV